MPEEPVPAPPPQTELPACYTLTLAAATRLVAYSVTIFLVDDAPAQFTFEGSDNGISFTQLDFRTGETWTTDGETRMFPVVSDHAYLYYRLRVLESVTSDFSLIANVAIYEYFASKTYSGTGESENSQQEADFFANQDAEAAAAADLALHCRQIFTALNHSATINCPHFQGTVTGYGNGYSFISQADADQQADAEAAVKAEALLVDCSGSNNQVAILIPSSGIADPYPSVLIVEDEGTSLNSVTVEINGLSHGSIRDVVIILQSPAGTCVKLMHACGGLVGVGGAPTAGAPVPPGIDLSFDDGGAALPSSGTFGAGTYAPTQHGGTIQTNAPAPGPAAPFDLTLGDFNGEDPNGAWYLWVFDTLSIGSGAIFGGWSLNIVVDP